MGLFSNFLVIEYRLAASKVRDFATSFEIDEYERRAIRELGIGDAHYILERQSFLIGICLNATRLFAETTQKKEVQLAASILEQILQEHLSNRPGMNAKSGLELLVRVENTYRIEEPEILAAKFLSSLTAGQLGAASVPNTPPILELTEYLFRKSLLHVQACTAKLK